MRQLTLIAVVLLLEHGLLFAQNPAGKVLRVDGDGDYMTVGVAASLQIPGDVTVEAWVNINSYPDTLFAEIVQQMGLGRSDLEKDNALFTLAVTPDSLVDAFHENGAGVNNAVFSKSKVTTGTWIHLANVRNTAAKIYQIFVNGVLDTTGLYSNNPTGGTNSAFFVGSNSGLHFDGMIDEVRVWNTARTQTQIQATMNDTLNQEYYSTVDSGLVGYWRFDQVENLGIGGDGLTDDIRDLSVNGNHGDLVGDATIVPGCSFTISPTSQSFPDNGGTGSVSVTAVGSNCNWTAVSHASWITITSGSGGTGNGTVDYSVLANTGSSSRTGTMAIAGLTFDVAQAGKSTSSIGGLFNTGVDSTGVVQPIGSIELHYNLTHSPIPGPPVSAKVINPATVYVSAPDGSTWIGLTAGNVSDPLGLYIYSMTFDLIGLDPTSAMITGDVAADNTLAIFINGFDIGFTHPDQYRSLKKFSINNGFVPGINTLEFRVTNTQGRGGANPTGLLVANLSGDATPGAPTNVYVMRAGNPSASQAVLDALTSRGILPTLGVQLNDWDGTQASLDTFQAVVLLNNYNFAGGSMPQPGQDALVNYVSAGGGLVTGEWLIWNIDFNGKHIGLDPMIPADYLAHKVASTTSYTQVSADPVLNNGLPLSFSFPLNNIEGGSESFLDPKLGATEFYHSSNTDRSGVVGWQYQAGRVISFSTVISQVELADSNYARLFANAVEWVTASPCTFSISPTSQSFPASGGTGSVSVTAVGSNCNWTAVSNDTNWIKITSGSSGSGNGNVDYSVVENTSNSSRDSTITIAGQTFIVSQEGASTSRLVRVADSGGSPGSKVDVPIVLEAQGDENALGFSLEFDPTILGNPQAKLGSDASSADLVPNPSKADSGCYGIALTLPTGQSFPAGIQEIIVVSFQVDSNTTVDSTTIAFKDEPIPRSMSDANANELSALWQSGTVRIFHGYEADVAPRFHGDRNIIAPDWVQVGRFVARLDTPRIDINEFQKADCAPKPCGNGILSVTDWVQAGRYTARLDPVVPACGPTAPTSSISLANRGFPDYNANLLKTTGSRVFQIDSAKFQQGKLYNLAVMFDAQGDENAIGFSISFDPAILKYDTSVVANDTVRFSPLINENQKDSGRVGFLLRLGTNKTLSARYQNIITITFRVDSMATLGSTTVSFGDDPIPREISDVNANTLSVAWSSGEIIITSVQEIASETLPLSFALRQNYPNPFNPATTIEFSLPQSGRVTLKIFDLIGREVAVLVDAPFVAGSYKVDWDASGLESGMYFYRIQVGSSFVQTRKLILMK